MAARITGYAESLSESTYNTDTAFQTKVTLDHTPSDSSTLMVFYSALVLNTNDTILSQARLRNSTSATTLCQMEYTPKDATDYICVCGLAIETYGASPAQQTYTLDYATGSALGTVKIKEAHIIVLELDATEFTAISDGPHTVTDTNWVTGATMTQTFVNGVDYYIFPMAEITTTSTSPRNRIRANYDGGAAFYGAMEYDFEASSDVMPWCPPPFKITGDGTSTTVLVECSSSSSTDVGFRKSRLVAVRADKFEEVFYDESRTRATTTSTTYQDKVTSTHTPAAVEHLIFGGGILDCGSNTSSAFTQLLEGATSLGEHLIEVNTAGAGGGATCYNMGYRKTLAASSTVWKTQFKSESGTVTTGIADSAILILRTGTAGGGAPVVGPGPQGLGNQFVGWHDGTIDPTLHKIEDGIACEIDEMRLAA